MVDISVEQTLFFVSKMSFPAFRSFSDESDDGSGAHLGDMDPLAVQPFKGKPAAKSKNYPGPRCSVLYCTNKKDDLNQHMSFHRFPKSLAMQKMWAKRTRPPLTSNLQNRFVCAIHFDSNVLRTRGSFKDSKQRLMRTAVPTLHLPPPEDEEGDLEMQSDHDPLSELDVPSEQEIDLEDHELSRPQSEIDPSRDIEMVELSSDEEVVELNVDAEKDTAIQGLTSADVLVATSALQLPIRPTGAPQKPRKSFGTERSPAKSVMSMDGSYHSDDEGDDDDIALVPSEELDYLELQDPLENAYAPVLWKNLNEKGRRATLRAYFSRIASYLPARFPRNSKMAILESATQYLEEVTKNNGVLAVENEILLQKHYKLRNAKRKIDEKVRRMRF